MFSLRTHAIICGILFAALIGIAILGNVLQRAGVGPLSGTGRTIGIICYFGLFVAFGFSAVPVMVKLVGSGRETTVIWTLWALMGVGLLIAVPAAIMGGMFGEGPRRMIGTSARPNLGVLAAKPGMTLDEVVAQSTLKLELKYASAAIAGGKNGEFDYKIPGTGLVFAGARYYYMTTFSKDPTRLEAVNVGVSREKLPPAALDSADADLRKRIATDGWVADSAGQHWLKDGVVLTISRNRMDEAKAGEDPATAGEWIQYLQLWSASTYPWFEHLVFPASRP